MCSSLDHVPMTGNCQVNMFVLIGQTKLYQYFQPVRELSKRKIKANKQSDTKSKTALVSAVRITLFYITN